MPIKNIKSDKPQLKTSKTKLKGEIKCLEKKLFDKNYVLNKKTSSQHAIQESVVF